MTMTQSTSILPGAPPRGPRVGRRGPSHALTGLPFPVLQDCPTPPALCPAVWAVPVHPPFTDLLPGPNRCLCFLVSELRTCILGKNAPEMVLCP